MDKNTEGERIINLILEKNPEYKLGKELGKGGFGLVQEIKHKDKVYAAKLIKIKKNESINEANLITNFRGPGIVKVIKILSEKEGNSIINHLIIMEKAQLRSLRDLNKDLHFHNIFKLIFNSPFELVGDNLIRFYARQIIKGLELLDRSNYSHFDIKPVNILTFINMT